MSLASSTFTPPPSSSTPTTTSTLLTPSTTVETFPFPPTHSFPPFYTPQPNTLTRSTQLRKWSALILAYAAHHRLYRTSLPALLATPLCHNVTIRKRLSAEHLREIVDFMVSAEGGGRAEWLPSSSSASANGTTGGGEFFIYWRTPAEWAGEIEKWVDETGQRGVVLTLYELVEGEGSAGREWRGMDMEVLRRSLQVLVKRGKAAVFGGQGGDGEGVKIF